MKVPSYPQYKHGGTPWLATMPEHWETRRLKFIADVCNGRDQKDVLDDDGAYDIFGSGGAFGKSSEFLYNQVSVLLGRKGTIDKPLYIERPFWTVDTMFYTRIAEGVDPKFFYYLCLTIPFDYHRDQTTLPSMTQSGLSNVRFAFPPPDEQQQIAAFLDWKTGQVDALIARKQELLEQLKERRLAVITQAVTRGLDLAAPLRDSGIPWLGQVPQHWEVMKFGYRTNIQEGQVNPEEELYLDMPLIAPNHIESNTGRVFGVTSAHDQAAISGKYSVRKGDVVYSKIRPHLNKCALVDFDGLCSADMYPIRTEQGLTSDFLLYWMLAQPFLDYATESSMRVAMPKLNRDTLSAAPLVVPPEAEQKAIVVHIRKVTKRIDSMSAKVESAIARLTEYRTALITTATTGKIDVRNVIITEPVA